MLNKIPGPSTNLIFSGLTQFLKQPLEYLEGIDKAYPNIARMKILQNDLVQVTHPELIKEVLQTHQKSYVKSSQYKPVRDILGDGLITSENPVWGRQRKILTPIFHKQSINGLFSIMEECVERQTEELKRAARRRQTKTNLTRFFTNTTIKVVTESIINRNVESELEKIYKHVRFLIDESGQRTTNPFVLPGWIPTPSNLSFNWNIKELRNLVREIIKNRKQDESNSSDMLSMLMAARYEDTGEPISEELLVDEINTIISAGFETTALSLTWVFYFFSTHPKELAIAQEEARQTNFASLNAEKVMQATYIRSCIQEAMRLYPPAWTIGKQSIEDVPIGDYTLSKGTDLLVNIYRAHRHPDYWENPDAFTPQRWEQQDKMHRFAYLPFSAGPRMCIGNHFAMLESALIVLRLLQLFDFVPIAGQSSDKVSRLTVRLKDDFYMQTRLR